MRSILLLSVKRLRLTRVIPKLSEQLRYCKVTETLYADCKSLRESKISQVAYPDDCRQLVRCRIFCNCILSASKLCLSPHSVGSLSASPRALGPSTYFQAFGLRTVSGLQCYISNTLFLTLRKMIFRAVVVRLRAHLRKVRCFGENHFSTFTDPN